MIGGEATYISLHFVVVMPYDLVYEMIFAEDLIECEAYICIYAPVGVQIEKAVVDEKIAH